MLYEQLVRLPVTALSGCIQRFKRNGQSQCRARLVVCHGAIRFRGRRPPSGPPYWPVRMRLRGYRVSDNVRRNALRQREGGDEEVCTRMEMAREALTEGRCPEVRYDGYARVVEVHACG